MGLRSDSFGAHNQHNIHHVIPANTIPPPHTQPPQSQPETLNISDSIKLEEVTGGEQKSEEQQTNDAMKITADPYTFYLSNSAATPTGPSPISHNPQHHSLPPTIVPIASHAQTQNSVVSAVNVAQVHSRINPNIHDSRNALMQQIMNRNASQQIEIDNLKQRLHVMTELELKNKAELHRYWSNEKALKQKLEKSVSDYKALEAKHDSLQIKYLSLNGKYKELLNAVSVTDKLQHFESRKSEDVIRWIMSLEGAKYKKYEDVLSENVQTENVDGTCLSSLDKGDLHRLGVTDFKDKKDLLLRIKELVQQES